MARYSSASRHIEILRTDEWGALTLKFSTDASGQPTVEKYREQRKRYWLDMPQSGGSLE